MIPTSSDILCGKDKTFAKHGGNRNFRSVIEDKLESYMAAVSKQDKMIITKEIVRIMRDDFHARFVTLRSGDWTEISDQMARDKISHALRFAASSKAKQKVTKSLRQQSGSTVSLATSATSGSSKSGSLNDGSPDTSYRQYVEPMKRRNNDYRTVHELSPEPYHSSSNDSRHLVHTSVHEVAHNSYDNEQHQLHYLHQQHQQNYNYAQPRYHPLMSTSGGANNDKFSMLEETPDAAFNFLFKSPIFNASSSLDFGAPMQASSTSLAFPSHDLDLLINEPLEDDWSPVKA